MKLVAETLNLFTLTKYTVLLYEIILKKAYPSTICRILDLFHQVRRMTLSTMVWAVLIISTNKVLCFNFRFDFWQLWHCLHLYRHCQNTLTKMEVSMLAHRLETADKVFQNVVPTLATLEPTRFSAQLSISQQLL